MMLLDHGMAAPHCNEPSIHAGYAARKASARDATRLPQKIGSNKLVDIAPGTTSIIALSTSSITIIETVSAMSATAPRDVVDSERGNPLR